MNHQHQHQHLWLPQWETGYSTFQIDCRKLKGRRSAKRSAKRSALKMSRFCRFMKITVTNYCPLFVVYHKMSTYDFIISARDRRSESSDVESGTKSPAQKKRFKVGLLSPLVSRKLYYIINILCSCILDFEYLQPWCLFDMGQSRPHKKAHRRTWADLRRLFEACSAPTVGL